MFNEYLLRAAFTGATHPDEYEFTLTSDGVPVGDAERVSASKFVFSEATVTGPFVVFPDPPRFDAVAMRAAGEVVEVWPIGSTELPAGLAFEFRPVIVVDAR